MNKTQFYKAWRKRGATPAEIMQRWQRSQSVVQKYAQAKAAQSGNPVSGVQS